MKTVFLLCLVCLAACSAPPSGLETAALNEARIEGLRDEAILLSEGVWEGRPYEEGAAVRPRAGRIQEFALRGDLSGEGQDLAAILLWSSEGGSGNLVWLSIVESAPERARSIATTLVGDRVQIIDLLLEGEQVQLDIVAAGPGDPACCPTQRERRRYRLSDGDLVGIAEVMGPVTTADLVGRTWRLDRFGRDDGPPSAEVTLEFSDPENFSGNGGCNAYQGSVVGSSMDNLELSAVASTMRRCPEDMTGTESRYFLRLDKVRSFSFHNGRLLLHYSTGDDEDSMIFSVAPAAANP